MVIKLGNKSHMQSFKQRVYASLETPMSARPLGKAIGLALIVLIVLNALLVGVPDRDLEGQFSSAIFIFSVFSTAVFALEYVCRIWIADFVYPHLSSVRARLRYVFSVMGIIDFLSTFQPCFNTARSSSVTSILRSFLSQYFKIFTGYSPFTCTSA